MRNETRRGPMVLYSYNLFAASLFIPPIAPQLNVRWVAAAAHLDNKNITHAL